MAHFKQKIANPNVTLGIERSLITRHYSFIRCIIRNGILYCYGHYQPTELSPTYNYRIKYHPDKVPVVIITSHKIEYDDDIHLYVDDNSLCLFHKTDLQWNRRCHLYDTIIPWTHEWFVFYELYQITGEWLHPYVPHKPNRN